jgi:hypothetical protein
MLWFFWCFAAMTVLLIMTLNRAIREPVGQLVLGVAVVGPPMIVIWARQAWRSIRKDRPARAKNPNQDTPPST